MRKNAAKHGTQSMYNNAPFCRCTECVKAKREYQRNYRAKAYPNGRRSGVKCRFGGCDKESWFHNRGLCPTHSKMLLRLVKRGSRTPQEAEWALEPL